MLHNLFRPFIKNGGLFIANRTEYELGDDVFILLTLMDEAEKIPVAGKVIWIAKKGVKQPHAPGVGVQCTDLDNVARDKIETYLAGSLGSASRRLLCSKPGLCARERLSFRSASAPALFTRAAKTRAACAQKIVQ